MPLDSDWGAAELDVLDEDELGDEDELDELDPPQPAIASAPATTSGHMSLAIGDAKMLVICSTSLLGPYPNDTSRAPSFPCESARS
jgi:hypothetical protein